MTRNIVCLAILSCVVSSALAADPPVKSGTVGKQTSNAPKQATGAGKQTAPVARQPAAAAQPSDDEAAIRKAIDSYVEDFNRADAKALAAHFAEQGSYVDPLTGERLVGREAIGKLFETFFAGGATPKLSVAVESLRLLDEKIAVEEGTAVVSSEGAPPETSRYLAIHVKKDGKWSLDSVRETELGDRDGDEANPLDDLEWMIGRWIDKSDDATVETVCDWTANKAFITRTFTVAVKNMPVMSGTQVVAWDPSAERIRSWVFDSDGSFGEGLWTREENRWVIKAHNTLSDGKKGTAVQIITKLDDNSFTWESIGREVDGELLPNVEPITIVRAPADN